MRFRILNFAWVFLFFSPSGVCADDVAVAQEPVVILLSLDGFRHDYSALASAPNLEQMAAEGLKAQGLMPVFPSSTFSNHYSIATGLYPGHHGIIGNAFYDRQRGQTYRLGDSEKITDGTWYGGEPLWVAGERAGKRAASYFWVGSEAAIQNIRPSRYRRYNGGIPNAVRVDTVLEWLALPADERPSFVTLYFSSVDSVGHRHGPESRQVRDAVASADADLGKLRQGLAELPFETHLIVVSDHGMQQITDEAIVYLSDHLNLSAWRGENRILPGGPVTYFYSDDQALIRQTADRLGKIDGLKLFSGSRPPAFSMLRAGGPRTPDLIAVIDAPGYISISRKGRKPPPGVHGYLPAETPTMNGILYAVGPRIKAGSRLPVIENVHVYPLVMALLGLEIKTPIDGRLAAFSSALED